MELQSVVATDTFSCKYGLEKEVAVAVPPLIALYGFSNCLGDGGG